MQDYFFCYLKLVYLQIEWLVEIPVHIIVSDFIELINNQFKCDIEGGYLFEIKSNRILDNQKSFNDNQVCSGDYLYFL